jgi:uncharacterized membrane protein YfcA
MDFLQILGYTGALLIGITLGLIGGGGSILTVPIFVYLLSINPVMATGYSLFVVGITSLVGALQNIRKGLVDFKTAIVFAIPAFIAVYINRRYLVPLIPETLFSLKGIMVTKEIGVMVFFALLMLAASLSMIRGKGRVNDRHGESSNSNMPLLMGEGFLIGAITGLVGAGGGFLIIPALVLLAKLPMKNAVATSLLIIAINSLIGFIGDIETMNIDWPFLLGFSTLSISGIFMGMWIGKYIDGKKLKKGFGWFLMVMGTYIIYKEIFILFDIA